MTSKATFEKIIDLDAKVSVEKTIVAIFLTLIMAILFGSQDDIYNFLRLIVVVFFYSQDDIYNRWNYYIGKICERIAKLLIL